MPDVPTTARLPMSARAEHIATRLIMDLARKKGITPEEVLWGFVPIARRRGLCQLVKSETRETNQATGARRR